MVLRLFLHAPGGLLRTAAAARPDGHRRRRQGAAVAVYRDLRDAAGGAAALRRAGGEAAARPLHSHRLSFLRRQSRLVLAAAHPRHRDGDRGARVLRLGQRVQPLRRRGVLVVHGRPVHQRARQAPVRLHRRRRHGRRAAGPGHHHRPFGAARPHQPADCRHRVSGAGGVLRVPARAHAQVHARTGTATSSASAAAPSPRCPS